MFLAILAKPTQQSPPSRYNHCLIKNSFWNNKERFKMQKKLQHWCMFWCYSVSQMTCTFTFSADQPGRGLSFTLGPWSNMCKDIVLTWLQTHTTTLNVEQNHLAFSYNTRKWTFSTSSGCLNVSCSPSQLICVWTDDVGSSKSSCQFRWPVSRCLSFSSCPVVQMLQAEIHSAFLWARSPTQSHLPKLPVSRVLFVCINS